MLEMYAPMVNSPITELANAIDAEQTTIEVVDGSKLPDAPNLAMIGLGEDTETILYTAKSGNVLSGVTRGFQGVAKAWPQGTRVARFFAAYDQMAIQENIKTLDQSLAAHLNDYASQEAKTYYIDSVNGNDSNDGLTAETAFKTWAKAESMIPKFVTHDYTIIIIGSLNEKISLEGRIISPPNSLSIRGNTTTASNQVVSEMYIKSCIGGVIFQDLQSTGQITIRFSLGTEIKTCNLRNSGGVGIYVEGSLVKIEACDFGNNVVQDCIVAGNLNGWGIPCMVMSYENSGNGTRYGLAAGSASVIGKRSTQPTGTTANEYTVYGGVIR